MTVAVVVCTYKRAAQLEQLLGTLTRMERGGLGAVTLQLLIVDNCPDGQVREVVERVGGMLPMPVALVEEARPGRTFARNRAAEEAIARGWDFVAFIDDDDRPEPDWFEHLVRVQRETGADIVCGAMAPVLADGVSSWMRASPLFDPPVLNGGTKYGIPRGIGTFNAMISVDVFRGLQAAGEIFSEEFAHSRCEDTEFFARARGLGAGFALAPDSVVHRDFGDDRTAFFGLLSYSWQMGKYNMILLRKHAPAAEVRARRRKALRKVLCEVPKMVLRARSRGDVVRYLVGVAKEAGMLAGAVASRPDDAGKRPPGGLPGAGDAATRR